MFQAGKLVLRKTIQNTKDPSVGKLALKWEGPHLIDSKEKIGAYWMVTLEGNVLLTS